MYLAYNLKLKFNYFSFRLFPRHSFLNIPRCYKRTSSKDGETWQEAGRSRS